MATVNIGARVEDLFCYGFKADEKLSGAEREEVTAWTLQFEECNNSREELEAMTDKDLIASAYCAMAEYASGQI